MGDGFVLISDPVTEGLEDWLAPSVEVVDGVFAVKLVLVDKVVMEAFADGVVLVTSVLTNVFVDKLVLTPDVVIGVAVDRLALDFVDVVTAIFFVVVLAMFVLVVVTATLPKSTVHADEI